jgi:hypothetical protein
MSMNKVKGPTPKSAAGAAAGATDSKKPAPAAEGGDKKKKKKEESDDEGAGGDDGDKPEVEDSAAVAEANQLKAEIDPILKSGAVVKALTTAVECKGLSVEVLRMQALLGLQAMESIKADDIAKFVDQASDEQLDALMRIVYHGMSTGKNCPNLLIWHAKITEKAGIGAIMRAMCGKSLAKE